MTLSIKGRYCDATTGQSGIVPFELTTDERRRLFHLCQQFGLLVRDIVSRPGDCMYILIKVLLRLPDSIQEMRDKVYEGLLQHLPIQNWAPSNEGGATTYDEYLMSVLRDGYGDEHVLSELCRIYNFDYSILNANGFVTQTTNNLRRIYAGFLPQMQHYVPAFPMVQVHTEYFKV
jgi:hypothetical protein